MSSTGSEPRAFRQPAPRSVRPAGLDGLDRDVLASLVESTADLILTVDIDGRISSCTGLLLTRDAAFEGWVGRSLDQTVTGSGLADAARLTRAGAESSPIALTHQTAAGTWTMSYLVRSLPDSDGFVLVGRLRPDNAETAKPARSGSPKSARKPPFAFRALFEIGSDTLLLVNMETGLVDEASRSALGLFKIGPGLDLSGTTFLSLFPAPWKSRLGVMLRGVMASGRPDRAAVDLDGTQIEIAARPLSEAARHLILLRIEDRAGKPSDGLNDELAAMLIRSREAILLTDESGLIQWANDAFLSASHTPLAAHLYGRSVEDFLDEPVASALLNAAATGGRSPSVEASLRTETGARLATVVDCIRIPDGLHSRFGFTISLAQTETAPAAATEAERFAGDVADRIGAAPMKELVRDTTDLVERMCIESALALTGNNRSAAARVLGLSRQALYLKLERFGIKDE